MRKPIVAGNWKMHKTSREAADLSAGLLPLAAMVQGKCEVVLCPPYTALHVVRQHIAGSCIFLGAQDMYFERQGAFTGEVSAEMLVDAGCTHVIIGHSERRALFHETDELVNRKAKAALASGLAPIMCVGETLAEREQGITVDVVTTQVRAGFYGISARDAASVVVAYEPVWAIGTGRASTGQDAEQVSRVIRSVLSAMYSRDIAESVRIQYGGSVKPQNMAEFASEPNIDGALVGGASLAASDFTDIVKATMQAKGLA